MLSKRHSNAGRRRAPTRNSRGMALVLVMGMIVLCSALVVAFFLIVRTSTTSVTYSASKESASELAASAVQIVEGTISHATDYHTDTTFAWASQPGMIRTYGGKANGSALYKPLAYYKLYSANNMVLSGSSLNNFTFSNDIDSKWDQEPACFTDLNAPILVNNVSGSGNAPLFPIVDPRAVDLVVEGFNYTSSFPGNNALIDGVINPTPKPPTSVQSPNDARRLPMPVRWIYILRDGSMITPDVGGNTIAKFTQSSVKPSSNNPIVGRLGYWTDDDCSKVNVNTASEGTYWDTPICSVGVNKNQITWPATYIGMQLTTICDLTLANSVPAINEFQRFGGHPATTCLSPVFGALDTTTLTTSTRASIVDAITSLTPRVVEKSGVTTEGGSKLETVSPYPLPLSSKYQATPNRLYSSIDEFPFAASARTVQSIGSQIPSNQMLVYAQVCRFFLTANSNAPDLNLFGLPRVSMWPVWDDSHSTSRTVFDNEMLRCSTVGTGTRPAEMIVSRKNPNSATDDLNCTINNQTNTQLYAYLQALTSNPVPGFGGSPSDSFNSKYGNTNVNGSSDRDQILAEMLDYIRCTNLADPTNNGKSGYTLSVLPGANANVNVTSVGQVVPLRLSPPPGGKGVARGFGRMASVVELALILIKIDDRIDDRYTESFPSSLVPVLPGPTAPTFGGNPPYPPVLYGYLPTDDSKHYNKQTPNLATTITTPNVTPDMGSGADTNPNNSTLLEWILIPRLYCPGAGSPPLVNNLTIKMTSNGFKIGGASITFPSQTLYDTGRIPCGNAYSQGNSSVGDGTLGGSIGSLGLVEPDTLFSSAKIPLHGAPAASMFPCGLCWVKGASYPTSVDWNTLGLKAPPSINVEGGITASILVPNGGSSEQTYTFTFINPVQQTPVSVPIPCIAYTVNAPTYAPTSEPKASLPWAGSFGYNSFVYPYKAASEAINYKYPATAQNKTSSRILNSFSKPGSRSTMIFGGTFQYRVGNNTITVYQPEDVVRSLLPSGPIDSTQNSILGDMRLVALCDNIPATVFTLCGTSNTTKAYISGAPNSTSFPVNAARLNTVDFAVSQLGCADFSGVSVGYNSDNSGGWTGKAQQTPNKGCNASTLFQCYSGTTSYASYCPTLDYAVNSITYMPVKYPFTNKSFPPMPNPTPSTTNSNKNFPFSQADWDNGPGLLDDGPCINKPDEGVPYNQLNAPYPYLPSTDPNLALIENTCLNIPNAAYPLPSPAEPYRQVSSPVIFGSLSAGMNSPWRPCYSGLRTLPLLFLIPGEPTHLACLIFPTIFYWIFLECPLSNPII